MNDQVEFMTAWGVEGYKGTMDSVKIGWDLRTAEVADLKHKLKQAETVLASFLLAKEE